VLEFLIIYAPGKNKINLLELVIDLVAFWRKIVEKKERKQVKEKNLKK